MAAQPLVCHNSLIGIAALRKIVDFVNKYVRHVLYEK